MALLKTRRGDRSRNKANVRKWQPNFHELQLFFFFLCLLYWPSWSLKTCPDSPVIAFYKHMAIKGEILHVRCIPLLPGSTSCWGLITRELSSAAWGLPMVNREPSCGLFRFITYYHRHVCKLAIAYRGFDFLLNENWLTYPTNVFLECGTREPSCKSFCTYDSGQPSSIFKIVRVLWTPWTDFLKLFKKVSSYRAYEIW